MKPESITPEQAEKLRVLSKIGRLLNDAKLTWAVGASAMLFLRGISTDFHDLDIMVTETDVSRLREILLSIGILHPPNPDKAYKTRCFLEFTVENVDVDVMAGFVIVNEGKEYDCSLQKEQITDYIIVNGVEIPLQSAEIWREFYRLMHRDCKVALIDSALQV